MASPDCAKTATLFAADSSSAGVSGEITTILKPVQGFGHHNQVSAVDQGLVVWYGYPVQTRSVVSAPELVLLQFLKRVLLQGQPLSTAIRCLPLTCMCGGSTPLSDRVSSSRNIVVPISINDRSWHHRQDFSSVDLAGLKTTSVALQPLKPICTSPTNQTRVAMRFRCMTILGNIH